MITLFFEDFWSDDEVLHEFTLALTALMYCVPQVMVNVNVRLCLVAGGFLGPGVMGP